MLPLIASFFSSLIGKSVVSAVVGAGKSWFQQWREIKYLEQKQQIEIKKAKAQAEIAKIERDQRMYADADVASIEQWEHSLIDELYKGTVLFLFWGPFLPPLSPYMLEGAAVLAQYPFWIQLIMAGTFISVLGLRYLLLAPLQKIFPQLNKNSKT